MVEHGIRYERLAVTLNCRNFSVWAHDHRGHGWNPHPEVGLGHFADAGGWRLLIDDAWEVSQLMMQTYPGVPLVLFAHSMGSFIAQALMAEHGDAYAGVVLAGTNGPPDSKENRIRILTRVLRALRGGRRGAKTIQNLVFKNYNDRFAPNRTSADWLTRDPIEVDRYVDDARCSFFLTYQSWLDFLNGRVELTKTENLDKIPKELPILVLAGERDPVGGSTLGVHNLLELYAKEHLSAVEHKFYDEARHELMNEIIRGDVTSDLISWILRITGVEKA
jgi:alpha-beta hydrolase superfamily lysophospholipase